MGCTVFEWLASTDGFVPRKVCGAWSPGLIWLHAGSDILIWLAYVSIPLALVYFARWRGLGRLKRIVWLFAAFILCCGFTHLIEALIFEKPLYHLSGVMKAITAVVSWATVLALIPAIPTLLTSLSRGESSREMPALREMPAAADPKMGHSFEQYSVAVLAAVFALLVRGLLDPFMAGDHAFVVPLLAVVFVAWHSGFWPSVVTLILCMVAMIFFFLEPRQSFIVAKLSDQLAVGFFLFAGVGCASLGQSQLNQSRRAARLLFTAESKQRELEAITQQLKQSQRQTAETLAQLDMFVMNAPLGMAFFDREMRLLRINKHLADANDLPVEVHLGKPFDELLADLPLEGLAESRIVLETEEALTNRLVVGKPNVPAVAGRVWESNYYPVREADGHLLGVGVVTYEISQKLRDEQALRDREAQFRSLAESMPQIVWITRPDGHCEYFNAVFYEYTGSAVGWGHGRAWLDALHPDDRAETERRWQRAVRTGEVYEDNYRMRGASGEYRWFLARGLPQRGDEGGILRWFGTSTDINDARQVADALIRSEALLQASHTELETRVAVRTVELSEAVSALRDEIDFRIRAEANVVASAIELRRSNGELEQFAYVASHDLQEPLRKIQAFGDRLKTKCAPQLGTEGVDYIERMLSSSKRMRQLINDLLAYSRLTTKTRSFSPVSLTSIAVGILSDLEIRIQQSGATVEVGALPTIDADPLQMRQLFQNLLSNALKFIRPEVPPVVTVSSDTLPGEHPICKLRFRDNGIGFDVKYLDRIFQVFQRLHGRGEYEGTGVGLAICHKIVHLHGGDITAESTPGQGATFIVTLPVRQPISQAGPNDS